MDTHHHRHANRRQLLRWFMMVGSIALTLTSCSQNTPQQSASTSPPTADSLSSATNVVTKPNLSGVTLRVAKFKAGWDLDLQLAGQDTFPYKVEFKEFTGGNLMVQAINADAIDLASGSEIPPIFAVESKAAVKVVGIRRGATTGQEVLVPGNSKAKDIADLKGKKVGYVKATTAHYFLIKMLEEKGLTLSDLNAVALSIPDGLSAIRKGELDGWATYGYSIPQAEKSGARELQSAKDILSGNFLFFANPKAIADSSKQAAIADFLCRLKRAQAWRENNVEAWSKAYAKAINVDEAIVLADAKESLAQRRSEFRPVSDEAIASQQSVADTFTKAGVLKTKVDVKPLWDTTFNDAITQCSVTP